MAVGLEAEFGQGGMDGGPGDGGGEVGAGADEEVEGEVVRGEIGMEDLVVEMEGLVGEWGLGVGSDHGVESEKSWAWGLGEEDLVGIGDVLGVGEGYGGDELAKEERIVEETIDEELGVDLFDLIEGVYA